MTFAVNRLADVDGADATSLGPPTNWLACDWPLLPAAVTLFASRLLIRAVDDVDDDDDVTDGDTGAGVLTKPAVSVGFEYDDDDPTTAVDVTLDFGAAPALFGSSLIVSFGSALIDPSAS